MNKTVQIWFAINKNGFIGLYSDKPERNVDTGKWESKFPFINSTLQQEITKLVEKSKLTWENDPECLAVQI